MDAGRRAEIRRWAQGLERSDDAELRAAGRALGLLADENEKLSRRLSRLEQDRGDDGGGAAESSSPQPPGASPGVSDETRRARRAPRRRNKPRWRLVVTLAALLVFAIATAAFTTAAVRPELETGGLEHGALVGAAEASQLTLWASSDADEEPVWLLDGRRVEARRDQDRYVFRPGRLPDGVHLVEINVGSRWIGSTTRRIAFEVDTQPPVLRLEAPAAHTRGDPVHIEGTVEPGASVLRGGAPVPLDGEGRFSIELSTPPAGGALVLELADRAGNRSRWRVPVTVIPRRPEHPVRSVHVTAHAWADKTLRNGVLELVRANKINAVELDLKDESGIVGWDAPVPYGKRIGAVQEIFDLQEAVRQLHGMGVRVIGRLVCFRDPIHAQAAWRAGRRSEVVQAPGGGPYAEYGGFTNFADPVVRKYNIDVGVAAAKLGVDEILYDYVRRPDGPISSMRFPGLEGTPERAVTSFLEESRDALQETGVLVGASVFGVSATRPKEVAQPIPGMARAVDYIAPMLYPSHWGPGEYGVADPNGSPYEIVRRSLVDFVRQTRGTGARVVPWLQDFSYGRTYGPTEVAAQIRAARDAGLDEFILWDAGVTYTADALAPTATRPNLKLTTAPPKELPGPKRLADPRPPPTAGDVGPVSGLPPNELGVVPVLMYHQIRPDRVGAYDQTPAEFRAELEYLWKKGYAPVLPADFVEGRIDLPAGKSPVVLTFDDSTTSQLTLREDGKPAPNTAVAILLDFARKHPGFEPKASFNVLRDPFGGTARSPEHLRWLVANGFELGNHAYDNTRLVTLSPPEVQRQLVAGARVIEDAVPGYRIKTMALPLGSMPEPARLAVRGRSGGRSYGPYAVLLVGANPAPSPYSKQFDPAAIPRIRSSHLPWSSAEEYTFAYWMR
ncbi:MAG TPA: putative glycoside hydrolase, partial [Gaiellaceae bacterium]|nr:putative glycoside hydrolase [Gaiellaceae bacterium]